MKFGVHTVLAATVLMIGLTGSARGEELGIGDPAPKLEISDWVKGQPVDLEAAKGKGVVVVEFWATWCGPCIVSIPHLTDLQKKFADKGLTIVGVTVEDPDNTLETVKKFVEKQGEKMAYTVAFDKTGKSDEAYMQAAKQQGIPTAFVVDQSGRIAWIGHPADELEEVVAEIFDGKYDIEAAKKWFALEARFSKAYEQEDPEAALKVTDEMIAMKPGETAGWARKIGILVGPLEKRDEAVATATKAVTALNDNANGLAGLAEMLIRQEGFGEQAQAAVKRAVDLAPNDADVRATQYEVLASLEKEDEALQVAQQVIELIKDKPAKLAGFARQLSQPDPKNRCNDLALKAVELALSAEPDEPAHLHTKFQILAMCKQDKANAEKVGRYLVEKAADDANLLNSFAWGLLTEPDLTGKYNELALAASERMHTVSGGKNWSYIDTLALAKFENGQVDEAIKLEKQAIELCDNEAAKPSLEAALKRFTDGKGAE